MASADDTVHKQSFSINDISTRSVTLYPTRAAVVRDILGVNIKSGRNEITIHNLTPQADEHSIKVEGHGTNALITDMTVDLVPNYNFGSTDSDSDSDSDTEPPKNPEIEQLAADIKLLRLQIDDAEESRSSAMKQLAYLDQLTNGLSLATGHRTSVATVTSVNQMKTDLHNYAAERKEIYEAFKASQATYASLNKELDTKLEKFQKLQKSWNKSLAKASRAKQQILRQKLHERRERQEQRLEVPRFVYRIRITIESESLPADTKVIAATALTGKPPKPEDNEAPEGATGPSLRISYITSGASWTPRYDLRLDTISGTGTLTYRAHFFNRTGEIWRNAKLTLSTSQTTFSGLGDKVPWMDSWRVTVRKIYGPGELDGALYSKKEKEIRDEKARKLKKERQKAVEENKPTIELDEGEQQLPGLIWRTVDPLAQSGLLKFGSGSSPAGANLVSLSHNIPSNSAELIAPKLEENTTNDATIEEVPVYHSHLHDVGHSRLLARARSQARSGGMMSTSRMSSVSKKSAKAYNPDPDPSDTDTDSETLNPPQKLGLAGSSTESYGLTTTYELPGLRTIPPSKLLRRHVIIEIPLPKVEFSHISVPKLRAAAFLKARIRNPSGTPLLRGPVGLTLDGSFLGNSTISRCAPDDHFELGLGVDESVIIEYRRPLRKVASQGMLVKEQVFTYERRVRIHNARGNHVKLVVFDQIPVSDVEKLKIAVTRPRGLKNPGDILKVPGTGHQLATGGSVGAKGMPQVPVSAGKSYVQVEMRKGGEVRWEAGMEAGKDAELVLEYEAKLPDGDGIFWQY